ncbi:hypothetical protein GVN17_17420 [Pseudomonas sp. SLFW]|nr:hypothetical protein [Pseudomonas sp. SLFW]
MISSSIATAPSGAVCVFVTAFRLKNFSGEPCNQLARPYVWVTARFLAHFVRPYSAVRLRTATGKPGCFNHPVPTSGVQKP